MKLRSASSFTFRVMIVFVGFGVGLGATASWAGYQHDYRQGNNTSVDGASSNMIGHSFYAPSNACVIYGITTRGFGTNRQVELGLVRCNGTSIDGTCNNTRFIETWDGTATGYACKPAGTLTNDTQYYGYIKRENATSTKMSAVMNAITAAQSGFPTNNTVTQAWGETTGGSNCPTGQAHGEFTTWQKFQWGSNTWSSVSNAPIDHDSVGINAAPCWTVGVIDSLGGFHVWPI